MNLLFLNFSLTTGMVWGLVVGAIIMLPIIFLFVCYYILAPKNIFFTFGRENRLLSVMIGKKFTGKVILPSKTIYVDTEDEYLIKKFKNNQERKKFKQPSIWGMHWIGIYPFYSIYERRQQWLEWKSVQGGERTIILRDEMTPYLFCKPFEYAMLLEEGEDAGGMPLNVYFTVTLMPTSATLPIFGNDNAYGQVQTKCLSQVLLFVKEKTFKDMGGDNPTSSITNDEFSLLLRKLNTQIPGSPVGDGIIKVLGYEITDAKLDKVEIGGEQKATLLSASTVEYIAKENAKAIIATADGQLEATKLEAQGKKAIFDVQTEYYKNISSVPGAMKVEERKATPGITTLTEVNGKKKPGLLIGGGK